MPTELGKKFDLSFAGKPTGMSAVDFDIWLRYHPVISDRCKCMYFDVRLGDGIDPGDEENDHWRTYWISKTQLRADVLLLFEDKVHIVELRDRASVSVVGRLLAYSYLLDQDNPFERMVTSEVVTNILNKDCERLCLHHDIIYTVI